MSRVDTWDEARVDAIEAAAEYLARAEARRRARRAEALGWAVIAGLGAAVTWLGIAIGRLWP